MPCFQAMMMADFILSAKTMNLDGRRSSWLRKLTMYTLATAGRKIARKRGESKGGVGSGLGVLFYLAPRSSPDDMRDRAQKVNMKHAFMNAKSNLSWSVRRETSTRLRLRPRWTY